MRIKRYKEYLVENLKANDIIRKTYYDSIGNEANIFLLSGDRFESEYQSRLYISNIQNAINGDGSINIDALGETISEIFRKYMNGESISERAKSLIEGVVL